MNISYVYRITTLVSGQLATVTCKIENDGKGWIIWPPVATATDGTDITDKLHPQIEYSIRDGANAMLYNLQSNLRKYDPYFGLEPTTQTPTLNK